MRDVLVLCGEATARKSAGAEVLRLDVDAPVGSPAKVNLRVDHITRSMVQDLPDRFADLLEIACYVYCADQFASRGPPDIPNMGAEWRRRFRFHIPVSDLQVWKRPALAEALASALAFLSDDAYEFEFVQRSVEAPIQRHFNFGQGGPPIAFDPDRIVLFSGGLDSLAGVAEGLLEHEQALALVSHHGSNMVRSKQVELLGELRERSKPGRLFDVSVVVNKGEEEAQEYSQRSRSFLFATLGFVVARLFGKTEVTFFENGVLSIHLPVVRHALGSRATRTTHPRVLAQFGQFFSLLEGETIQVVNPYVWLTKAEVVGTLARVRCEDLLARSFSCTRVRDATRTRKHCGVCSQCIDRRFAVLAAGLAQYEPAELYRVDLFRGERSPGRDLTLLESFVMAADEFAAMSEAAFATEYGEVFRALPYLGEDQDLTLARLHDLHRRHGAAVTDTIMREIARHSFREITTLPETSLLALVLSNVAQTPIRVEPAEVSPEVDVHKRAEQREAVQFAMDEASERVRFAGGIALRGAGFRLIEALMVEFEQDRAANRAPDDFQYVPAAKLAKRLEVDDDTLRQNVTRTRGKLRRQFLERLDKVLDDQAVIQNERGRGYRLNPHLVPQPLAFLAEGPERLSRKSPGSVTNGSTRV